MPIQLRLGRILRESHKQGPAMDIRSNSFLSLLERSVAGPSSLGEQKPLEMAEATVHIPSHIVDEISLVYGLGDVQLDPIPRLGNSYANFSVAAQGAELTLRRRKGSAVEIGVKHPDIGKRIRAQHALVSYLQSQGFPVAPPLPTKDSRTYVNLSGVPYSLYPRINGQSMDPTNLTQLAVAGRTLAKYHRLTTRYRGDPPVSTGLFRDVFEEHLGNFHSHAETLAELSADFGLKESLQSFNDWLPAIHREVQNMSYDELPKTMIHGNYAPKNILFQNDELVAVIGFGQSRYDTRLVDLSITTYRLMKAAQRDWTMFEKLTQAFTSAYDQVWPLQAPETRTLPTIAQGMMALRAFKKARRLAEKNRDKTGDTTSVLRSARRLGLVVEKLRWLRENSEEFSTMFRESRA